MLQKQNPLQLLVVRVGRGSTVMKLDHSWDEGYPPPISHMLESLNTTKQKTSAQIPLDAQNRLSSHRPSK